MRIEDLDKNFTLNDAIRRDDIEWHDVREGVFSLHGLCVPPEGEEAFHRVPTEVAEATSPSVATLNYHTAGIRARFYTDSPFLALLCELRDGVMLMSHMPLSGSQGFDLYRDTATRPRFCRAFFPPADTKSTGFSSYAELPAGGGTYTLNFPLYGTVKRVHIGIKEGSRLSPATPYAHTRPVVFYGSSITQGGCASRPGNTYEEHLSRRFGFDYINLGFSGSARGERAIVKYMASLDMSVFVCDYDHNAPDLAHLQETLAPLYEAVRTAHPTVPFIFASAPGLHTGEARRAHIREVYERARAHGDTNVYFVDGAHMFDGDGSDTCTLEGCHPNDLGFFRMYEAFAEVFEQLTL